MLVLTKKTKQILFHSVDYQNAGAKNEFSECFSCTLVIDVLCRQSMLQINGCEGHLESS